MIRWLAARRQRLAAMAMSAAVHGTAVLLLVRLGPRSPVPPVERALPERLKEFPGKRILYFHPAQLLPPVSPEATAHDEGLTIRLPQPEWQTAKLSDAENANPRALTPPPRALRAEPTAPTVSAPPAPVLTPPADWPVATSATAAIAVIPETLPSKPKVRFAAPPPPVAVTTAPVVLEPAVPSVSAPAGLPSLVATAVESGLPGRPAPPIEPTPSVPALPLDGAQAGSRSIELGISRGEGEGRQSNAAVIPGVAVARTASNTAASVPPLTVPPPPTPTLGAAVGRAPVDTATSEISIAQRPGARSVPAPVERVFGDRVIFTTVLTVPVESEGRIQWQDWIAWFAEPSGSPATRFMRPPKVAPRQAAVKRPGSGRLLVVAKLNAEGVSAVIQVTPAVDDPSLARGIEGWAWRPAQRGAQPVPVDLVIEMP